MLGTASMHEIFHNTMQLCVFSCCLSSRFAGFLRLVFILKLSFSPFGLYIAFTSPSVFIAFSCLLDCSSARQIFKAVTKVSSSSRSSRYLTRSEFVPYTRRSRINSSSKMPKLQFFAMSFNSVTY